MYSPEIENSGTKYPSNHKRNRTQQIFLSSIALPCSSTTKKDNPVSKINQYSLKKMISPSKHIFNGMLRTTATQLHPITMLNANL
jgi:hypothetical protein